MDAVAFVATFYWVLRASLQGVDGALAPSGAWLRCGAGLGALVALRFVAQRLGHASNQPREAARELGGIALAIALPTLASYAGSTKGISWLWLAQEWSKIPANFVLLERLSPLFALAAVACFATMAGLAAAVGPGRRARFTAWAPGLLALAITIELTRISASMRISVYFVVYALPWVICARGLWRGRARLAARAAALGSATGLLLVHYVGLTPLGRAHFADLAGVKRIYPADGETPAVPLAFLRDFELDAARGKLYSAYGPTSGILVIDLASGVLTPIPVGNGLVRHLRNSRDPNLIYALDWVHADLLRITKEPFAIEPGTTELFGPKRLVPMSFLLGAESAFVIYTEEPGLAELDLAHGAITRTMSFRELGLTSYRSGAWEAVGDADQGFLAVEIGATDATGRYRLARIDLKSLTVERTADVPDGGLAILWVPERSAIITAGFFTDRIFEFDATTLELRRTLHGPLNCRALAYDAHRDLLVATAFLPGELWMMRWADGSVVSKDRVGNKSMSLALDRDADRLYLGSEDGVFAVDLATFTGQP